MAEEKVNQTTATAPAEKKPIERQAPLMMAAMGEASRSQSLMPNFKTFGEIFEYCNWVSTSSIVPECYRERPADIFVAAQYGHDIGLPFMTSVQNIAVIGGRPALPSDIKLAMVRGLDLLEDFEEASIKEIKQTGIAWCRMKRIGVARPMEHTCSVDDAKVAGVWEKLSRNGFAGPWVTHKWRMLQLKPRDMCLRDLFGDVYKGLHSVEEAQEIEILNETASTQALIEQASQPDTKGKEIFDAPKPPLKQAEREPEPEKKPEPAPAKEPEPEPRPESKAEEETRTTPTEKSLLARLTDEQTTRLRAQPGGNAALLKLWSKFKLATASFAKGIPSDLLPDDQLPAFNIELEAIVLALDEANRAKKK